MNIQTLRNNHVAKMLKRRKDRKMSYYQCSSCKYRSSRLFNVMRHAERIHSPKNLRVCCGEKLFTKGEYYAHCESVHPHTRPNAIISRNKYKITGDDVVVRCPRVRRYYFHRKTKQTYTIKQRCSERLQDKKRQVFNSRFKLEYSLTCGEYNIDDVPLIYFLNNKRLRKLLRKQTGECDDETSSESIIGEPLLSEDPQGEAQKFEEERVEEACTSCTSVSSTCIELPTKKLLLHRFMANVKSKIIMPLQERNNNDYNQADFHGFEDLSGRSSTSREPLASVKRLWTKNKENMPDYVYRCKQEINICLDSEIPVPVVTQMHRDFLSSIDFDKFRTY